ncbi:MAG: hypothetical protein U5R06_23850 [candidate division KSB1 bacterium]|nr:hypothetical protein [candidate division KSB1 bacterium]
MKKPVLLLWALLGVTNQAFSFETKYSVQTPYGCIIHAYQTFESFLHTGQSWHAYQTLVLSVPQIQVVHNRQDWLSGHFSSST